MKIPIKIIIPIILFNFFSSIVYSQTDINNESITIKQYNQVQVNQSDLIKFNCILFPGLWIPTGDNKLLGIHPEIGFGLGILLNRVEINYFMQFKFLNSKNTYIVTENNRSYETREFFGGYIGIEISYFYINFNLISFYISGGIGFDGFDALEENNEHAHKSINSLNINIGYGCRYFINENKRNYVFGHIKYNFVNYKNDNGTDLSGNTISIRFGMGFYF